jgi:hypothetical protein
MTGRTIETPFLNSLPGPVQLTVNNPAEFVSHEFIVETGERIGSEPWLIGMDIPSGEVTCVMTGLVDVGEVPGTGVMIRRYSFAVTAAGPSHSGEVVSFLCRPVTRGSTTITPARTLPVRILLAGG